MPSAIGPAVSVWEGFCTVHGRDGAVAAALPLSRGRRYPSICIESEGRDVERLSHIFCACGGARATELWTVDADRLSDMVSARARPRSTNLD